jgi:Ankyrin repeat
LSTVIPLPERPNLEQLKKQARELANAEKLKLTAAQLRVAHQYGFASWTKLKAHVEMVTRLTRTPDALDSPDDFLALACLCYTEADQPAKFEQASRLVTPTLARRDIWTAAALASVDAVRSFLAADPSLASREGGPQRWEPLMFLAYARFSPAPSEADVLATANALLDAGANPNVGYLWHGLPTPFTVLTGVLGDGENKQSIHPHWKPLATLLLERGADPNDTQGLYNRQFQGDTEHLALLFAHGLGQGDGGEWKQRMGDQMESPGEAVQHQLRWAIHHNMTDRVRLFLDNDVATQAPFDQPQYSHSFGRTPAQWAALCGHAEIVALLGESEPLSDADAVVVAVMRGEAPAGDIAAAIAQRPSLVVQAAAAGNGRAVRQAVRLGWDVNALGRADAPCEVPWQTALHTAVERNDAAMVRLLLGLGADPSITDARFDAAPLRWCEHFGHTDLADLLA